MSNPEKFQNLDVTEAAPNDLDEVVETGSRWTRASKLVTGVAGGIALASGAALGATMGVTGTSLQSLITDPNVAFADEPAADDAFTEPAPAGFQKVQLSSGQVVTISTAEPVPAGAVVIAQPTAEPTASNVTDVAKPGTIELPPLPTFDTANTSSATPAAGGGSGGSGGYGDDNDGDDDHHDGDHHEDNEDHEDSDD